MREKTIFVKLRRIVRISFSLIAVLVTIFLTLATWGSEPYAPFFLKCFVSFIVFVFCSSGSIVLFDALFIKEEDTKIYEQRGKTKKTNRPTKHYAIEDNAPVDLKKMKQDGFMPENEYRSANANLVLACHDVFIKYADGILLVKRKTKPAINVWWPLGGRILKGFSNEESLSKRVESECGLKLTNIQEIGCSRVILGTDPFGHGKGVDAIAIVFYAESIGKLNLDQFHFDPQIITPKTYTEEFRETLHPYVRDYMDIAIAKL
jgi:hypothetical protein